MPSIKRYFALITGATMLGLGIQGCMASSNFITADEAFALSASALSGSESYEFAGQVSLFDPEGFLGNKAAFEGEVTSHGNLKIQWKSLNAASASLKPLHPAAYRPLQLLEFVKGKSAVIAYTGKPVPNEPVQLQIKLNDKTARERVAEGLREEFALLRADSELLRRDPVKSEKLLSSASKRLEAALSTLKVTTVCQWTADSKDWFPYRMKEETALSYTWDGKPYREKRVSETKFLRKAQDGTIKKLNK